MQEEWAQQIGYISAGSRIGSILSSILFGKVLSHSTASWRTVFWVACGLQTAAVIAFTMATKSIRPQTKLEVSTSLHSPEKSTASFLLKMSSNPSFWLMLVGKSCLMLSGQFISFLPLYLSTGLQMTTQQAASYSALFAVI